MAWRCFAASAIGKGHIDTGLPCQDAHAQACHADDPCLLIAVVCDGAGSAAHSAVGAQLCADGMVAAIQAEAACRLASADFSWKAMIGAVRTQLQAHAEANDIPLREMACTVVGVVAWPDRGALFHIGDGLGIVEMEAAEPVVSAPENGEYANETWFITAEEWAEHLRITPFTGKVRRLALMSDGAMPFVLGKTQRAFFSGFIDPVSSFLAGVDTATGNQALLETLSSPATHTITADDKTLLIAFC
jgi:hypothetical protein